MKGTLFSADFAIDSSDNPKLLEINTDTAIGDYILDQRIDYSDFINILSGSNITKLTVIHKNFQDEFVKHLHKHIFTSASFLDTWEPVQVDDCSIYPNTVTDASDKFILRLAYDESAVFDSNYAKSELKLYDLFNDNSDIESCVPVYHSSSTHGVIDSLSSSFNDPNIPDFATKSTFTMDVNQGNLKFWKLGLPSTGSDYRLNIFKSDVLDDTTVITNYLDSVSGSFARSIRSFHIIYGNDLDLCHLGEYEVDSILEAPTLLATSSYSSSAVTNLVSNKHRFEFVTNYPKIAKGIGADTFILSSSGAGVQITSAKTGSDYTYQSYFISGSPDTDDFEILDIWEISGSVLPSGSHISSSILDSVTQRTNKEWALSKLTFDSGHSSIIGSSVHMASYDATQDNIGFRKTYELHPGDLVYDSSGNAVTIVSHSLLIYDNLEEAKGYDPDLSSVDTYVLSGSNVVLHNPYGVGRWGYTCFLAGTKITMEDGSYKNIEDIVVGDRVKSFTLRYGNSSYVSKSVTNIDHRHTLSDHAAGNHFVNDNTDSGYFTFNGDNDLRFSCEHPFLTKDGWKAVVPYLNQEPFATELVNNPDKDSKDYYIKVGDFIFDTVKDDWVELTSIDFTPEDGSVKIYNFTVEDTHTYIAGDKVVHNK